MPPAPCCSALGLLFISLSVTGCSRGEAAPENASNDDHRPRRVLTVLGARDPESVRYDPDQDAYFISMMNGFGSAKDNNGYIVRVPAGQPSQLTMFAESGKSVGNGEGGGVGGGGGQPQLVPPMSSRAPTL